MLKPKIMPKTDPIIGSILNMYAIELAINDTLDIPRTKFITKLIVIILSKTSDIFILAFDKSKFDTR